MRSLGLGRHLKYLGLSRNFSEALRFVGGVDSEPLKRELVQSGPKNERANRAERPARQPSNTDAQADLSLPEFSNIVVSYLPWVVGLLVGLLILIKVAAVSRFDTTTSLTILNVSNQLAILLGTALLMLPDLLRLLLLILTLMNFREDPSRRGVIIGFAIPLMMGILLLDNLYVALVQVVGSWLALNIWPANRLYPSLQRRTSGIPDPEQIAPRIKDLARQKEALWRARANIRAGRESIDEARLAQLDAESERYVSGLLRLAEDFKIWNTQIGRRLSFLVKLLMGLITFFVTLTLLRAAMSETPWLPLEQISRSGGSVLGYVLSERDQNIVFLRDRDRVVITVSARGLTRRLCRRPLIVQRSSLLLRFRHIDPKYPECAEK